MMNCFLPSELSSFWLHLTELALTVKLSSRGLRSRESGACSCSQLNRLQIVRGIIVPLVQILVHQIGSGLVICTEYKKIKMRPKEQLV
jgi:hypothetical protein